MPSRRHPGGGGDSYGIAMKYNLPGPRGERSVDAS